MSIDNRTAKRRLVDAVSVGAQRKVPAGHFPLELPRAGITEHGDAVLPHPAVIILGLPFDALIAVFGGYFPHDLVDEFTLLLAVERMVDQRLGDIPIGID